MAAPDVQKLLELDLETRLALVQQLWDSIVADANAVPSYHSPRTNGLSSTSVFARTTRILTQRSRGLKSKRVCIASDDVLAELAPSRAS